ncbi:MAG: hypothetical protein ACFFCW_28145 [Candidatus Hodarchaeota archaeon]
MTQPVRRVAHTMVLPAAPCKKNLPSERYGDRRGLCQKSFCFSVWGSVPEEELLLQFHGMIAERTRRGKRYRAKTGLVNVLSGAPRESGIPTLFVYACEPSHLFKP